MYRMTVCNRIALFLLASVVAFGETRTKGMIKSRTGETLIVSSAEGNVTVVLTDDTKTRDKKGLLGMRKEQMSNTVLIPGLKVDVDGVPGAHFGQIVAKTITVDGDDLETAQMIQSGLHPTAEQVAANVRTLAAHQQGIAANQQGVAANKQGVAANKAQLAGQSDRIETNQQNLAAHTQKIEQNMKDIQENTDRFRALSEYDTKGEATVKFTVGSVKISPEDKEELKQLAQTATSLTGYIIEVMGYADASGSAEMNTKLSEDRAKAVVTYLIQQGNVPVRHIVAPGAMGEYGPAASNETQAGRAENRRVEVKVLVNKAIAGK